MGFATTEDESVAMPLDLCKTTTLVCPPDSWFYLTKRWETTPQIHDPAELDRRRRPFWTLNRLFIPYHERRYDVTILLGRKGVPRFPLRSVLPDHERGRAAFCLSYIIRQFCRSTGIGTPFDFTVGPFLGRAESVPKDHRWCFGSRVPDDIEEGGYTVRFRSECDCGNGDVTHCKYPLRLAVLAIDRLTPFFLASQSGMALRKSCSTRLSDVTKNQIMVGIGGLRDYE